MMKAQKQREKRLEEIKIEKKKLLSKHEDFFKKFVEKHFRKHKPVEKELILLRNNIQNKGFNLSKDNINDILIDYYYKYSCNKIKLILDEINSRHDKIRMYIDHYSRDNYYEQIFIKCTLKKPYSF